MWKILQKGAVCHRPFGVDSQLVNGLVVSVNHTVISGSTLCAGLTLGISLLIHLLAYCIECLLHILGSSLDSSHIVALVDFLQLIDCILNGCLLLCGDLVAQLIQSLLGLIDGLVSCVVGVNLILASLILSSVLLSLTDSLVDVFLAQVGGKTI